MRAFPPSYTAGIKTINAIEVSKRAKDAWNRHNADALYAEGATYHNPRMDNHLTGKAIANFAKSVAIAATTPH